MKLFKSIILGIGCLIWIIGTNYKVAPINSLGALLTYKTGLLNIPLEDNLSVEINSSELHPTIHIDSLGIPHVYGESEREVAFGLGYMHAKDRYFQMEMMSRMVLGRIAELIGKRGVQSDTFWRPFEFDQKAKEILEEYKATAPALYQYLMAYNEGVTSYFAQQQLNDPLYTMFDAEPLPWKPYYGLLVTWYMSGNLAYFDYHVERQELITTLPEEVIDFLFPLDPDGLKTILPAVNEGFSAAAESSYDNKGSFKGSEKIPVKKGHGSNNWAVNAEKTKAKHSMLANDPHLFLTLPNAFYETHLVAPSLNIYGYSIPGVPIIVSGHNESIAWGITNGEWDLTDRYALTTKGDSLYFYNEEWIAFTEKEYTIKLKSGRVKTITQMHSLHGRVFTKDSTTYYAQYWHPSSKSYAVKAMHDVMHSANWSGFKKALKTYDYPPQNFIYSDLTDTIGIVCAGKLPIRPVNYAGGLFDGAALYEAPQYLDTLWETSNPSTSFLFSANQQTIQNDSYFGAHWHKDDYRTNRIHELLAAKSDWDVRAFKEMQLDEVDLTFKAFAPLLERYPIAANHFPLVKALKKWDGDMSAESSAALVFEVIQKSITKESKIFAKNVLKVEQAPSNKYFLAYLQEESFEIADAPKKEKLLFNILQHADSTLNKQFPESWEGKTYRDMATFTIPNIGFLPGLGVKMNGVGGNKNTINMSSRARPAFRSVVEMKSESIEGYTVLAGGQSGKVNSTHYKDQLNNWKEGDYHLMQFSRQASELKNITSVIKFK